MVKDDTFYIPAIATKHQLAAAIPGQERDLAGTFPESAAVAGARHLVINSHIITANAEVVHEHCREELKQLKSVRGRNGADQLEAIRVVDEREQKLMAQKNSITKVAVELQEKLNSLDASGDLTSSFELCRPYLQKHDRPRA